ncbi:MAG: hypothetical protein NTX34_07355 [Cytophagales bacterium]|nr:hypothetical protein [Cytophagales bacterium]
MKSILSFLIIIFSTLTLSAQSWNLEVGNNLTRYVFTNSSGNNPEFLKPSSGLHFSLSKESKFSKNLSYDLGLAYNQFNNVGDVQNIPFSYQTDFIGIFGAIGPSITTKKDFTLSAKATTAVQSMINGNQFLQNHFVDLAGDSQFSGLKLSIGYTFSIAKKVNEKISVFTSYQHLDTINFGASTLNFIPSTFSCGLKISQ